MRAIFISYRREDAEGQAGRLFDDLSQQFGDDSVFMDVAAIEPGRDFRKVIDQHVASCGVLLALIGKAWLTAKDESGGRRLDDPADFVRLETASALKRDIPVVPVLVQGAKMPRAEDLPDDLKELAFRNGVELTHARWDSDMQVLVKALRSHVQGSTPAPVPGVARPPVPAATAGARSPRLLVGGLAALAVAGAGAFVWYQQDRQAAVEIQRAEALQREETARLEAERLEQEKAAAVETALREQAAAAEEARRQESALREAQEKQAREQTEREAAAAREQAVREAREQAAREAREQAAREQAAREREAKLATRVESGTTVIPDPARRVRWKNGHFPPPNGGSVLFTITSGGDPACASYDGGACLWNMSYAQVDFSKVKPLVCGDAHKARWGATGYEDPKHWCSLARKWNSP
jgi:flagellar biosynthesis GTPase FlhF